MCAICISINGSVLEKKSAFKMLELSSMKFLSYVVELYRDKFAIHRHKECCCGFLLGSSNWYLDVFEKLHKSLFRAVTLIPTACLELALEALCYIRITLELVLEALRFLRNTFEYFDLRLFLLILRLRFCFCCCFF